MKFTLSLITLIFSYQYVFSQNKNLDFYISKTKKYKYSYYLDSTKFYFKKGLHFALKKRDSISIFYLYKDMGDAYEHHQKLDSTLLMYSYCKQYTPKNNLKLKSFLLNDLAYTYNLFHDYEKATKLIQEALKYAEKSNNKNQIAAVSIALAYNFANQKLDNQAEFYFKKALEIDKKSSFLPLKEYVNRYYGNFLLERNKLNEAYQYLTKASKYSKQSKDSISMAFAWIGLAECYWKKKNIDKCFFYAKKAEGVWFRRAEYIDYALVCMNQGTYYLELKDYKKAENCFKKAEKHLLNDLYFNEKLYSHLANLYKQINNFKQAIYYLEKAKSTIEQIKENESKSKVASLNIQFDTQRKEQLIKEEKQKNELTNLKLETRTNQIKQIIIVLFFLTITLILIIHFYKINLKRNKIIQAQKEDLDEINATKDKLFSIISHDLRSSVNALKTSNDKLLKYLVSKNYEELDCQLHKNSSITNGIFNLLDNLLNWANQQTNQIYFNIESLHLKTIVQQVEYNFKPLVAEKNLNLNIDIDNSFYVNMDLDSLKIILRNILDNALKYSKENGTISIISNSQNENFVFLNIEDNGIGMTEEVIVDLLNENNKLSKKNNPEIIGSGLGFQLCKSMIDKNGGKLNLESKIGIGTKILLSLPK